MGRFIAATNSNLKRWNRPLKLRKAVCETLEPRQLMSLTIAVRGTDAVSTSQTVSGTGPITLDLVAIITDANNTPTQDGLQDVQGQIISSAAQGHAVAGDLTAAGASPFTGLGQSNGTRQDINGDGNIDVGSLSISNSNGDFVARSSTLQTSATGTVVGSTLRYVIGTITYNVTNLNRGGTTNINFGPYVSGAPDAAAWLEDNTSKNNVSGTFQAGTPFTISAPSLIVPPVAVNDSATATRNTPLTINELANDDKVVALNPASVTIVSNVTHGTTAVQSDGTVLYTPATGYTGADSFTYHVADTDGRVSNVATVSINVVLAPAPIAGAVAATTLRNQTVSVNVLAQDTATAPATVMPSSVVVINAPTNGTAVVQSDGTVLYTPHTAFVGTDTFTYTVTDTNAETSNPGTVTVTVNTPTPPTVNADVFTTTAGAPVVLDVLTNDTTASAPINLASIDVDSTAQHGITTVNSNGTILYSPNGGYVGNDSFTYSVSDTLGESSNTAVVTITITNGIPPVAADFTATALSGQANTINVTANVTSGATLTPATLAATGAAHGTVTANTDGTVTYTPTAGFVGADSFTYNVGNVNLDTSNTATVNVFVGTTISNAKGASHSLTYTDAAGGLETISLNRGSAQVFFSGVGALAVSKSGKATVTGTGLNMGSIALSGTTSASTLSIKGAIKTPATLGGLSSSTPMGTVSAASVNLSGTVTLPSAKSLIFGSVSNASLEVGTANSISTSFNFSAGTLSSAPAPIAGRLALTLGPVTDSSIISEIPLSSAKIASWNDSGLGGLSAPTIGSLAVAGGYNAALFLGANVAGHPITLSSARIGGALAGDLESISAGAIGSISAGSVAGSWTATVGSIKSFTVKTGGLASNISAGTIGTLSIAGNVTGSLSASSATSVKVIGDVSGGTITFTQPAGVRTLTVTGAINGETITSAGNIGTITAGSMSGTNITAAVPAGTTFANSTAATLGSGTITSVRVSGKTPTFTNTNILAGKITSVSLGTVTANNGGAGFGLATKSLGSFAGTFANGPARIGRTQLLNETILTTYLTQQSIVFGDFAISLES